MILFGSSYGFSPCGSYVLITFLSMSIPMTLPHYSLLETMHSAFAIRLFYYLLIISFGRMDMVAKIDWYAGSFHVHAQFLSQQF